MSSPVMVVDTHEFEQRIRLLDPLVMKEAHAQMVRNTEDLLREAGALTPVDEGTLLASGTTRTSVRGHVVEGEVGFNTPYATRVHYEMSPAPESKMKPGPITRSKPGTEFGQAGGLYLQRPLFGKMMRYTRAFAERFKVGILR